MARVHWGRISRGAHGVQRGSKVKGSLRRRALRCALGGLCVLLLAVPLVGAEEPEPEALPGVAGGGAVPLDRLLRLPSGTGQGTAIERRGGHTKAEWQARFREARAAEVEAREEVAKARAAIEKKAAAEGGGQWRMGAPGLGAVDTRAEDNINNPSNPLDYGLTQRLRRGREELARAERALQDLEVEANLASVPPEWRGLPDDEAVVER